MTPEAFALYTVGMLPKLGGVVIRHFQKFSDAQDWFETLLEERVAASLCLVGWRDLHHGKETLIDSYVAA